MRIGMQLIVLVKTLLQKKKFFKSLWIVDLAPENEGYSKIVENWDSHESFQS